MTLSSLAVLTTDVASAVSDDDGTTAETEQDENYASATETQLAPAGELVSLDPARVLESRDQADAKTVDGLFEGGGRVAAGETVTLDVVGRGGVPAVGVSAVVMNVTAIVPSGRGFVTVFPCGGRPLASSLNYDAAGVVVGNELVAKLNGSGQVCLFTSAETHLTVDVVGYVPESSSLVSLEPARVLESRDQADAKTVDGLFEGGGRVAAGETVTLDVVGRGGVPAVGVSAVVMNVTAIVPSGRGFVTVFPCGGRPLASSLNYDAAGVVVGNELVAKLNDSGQVCLFTSAETHLTVDVVGYVPTPVDIAPGEIGTLTNPKYAEGWHAEPKQVLFDGDGQTREVSLVHYGSDGSPSGRAVPDGVTVVRSTPLFNVTAPTAGTVTVAGSETIGSELIALDIPGEAEPVSLWISSVRYKDEVALIENDRVVMPPPLGATIDDVAPFTVEELAARVNDELGGTAPMHFPFVLRGSSPPTGELIAGPNVLGRVIELAGAPTVERGGLALVTVEVVGFATVFDELDMDVDYAQLTADGVLPTVEGEQFCLGGAPGDGCSLAGLPRDSIGSVNSVDGEAKCQSGGSVGIGELKVTVTPTWSTNGGVDISLSDGGAFQSITVTAGMTASANISLSGKAALSGKLDIDCELDKYDPPDINFPPPVGAILSGATQFTARFKLSAELSGGMEATINAGCTPTVNIEFGAAYSSSSGGSVFNNSGGPSLPCTFDYAIAGLSAGELGPAVSVDIKPSVVLELAGGVRFGAQAANVLGVLIQEDDLGKFLPLNASVGPELALAMETPGNVFTRKAHKTGAALNLVFKIGADTEPLDDLIKTALGFPVSIPLLEFELGVPLGALLSPPSPASGLARTINGETQAGDGVLTLEADDVLGLSFAAPATTGLVATSLSSPVYTYDIEVPSVPVQSSQFDWNVTGTGASLSLEMTQELCDTEFGSVRSFQLLGYLGVAGVAAIPVHLGNFAVQCARNVRFEDPSQPSDETTNSVHLDLSRRTESVAIDMIQSALDGEAWSLSDPGDPYVTVSPSTGTFGQERTPLSVDFDCGDEHEATGELVFALSVDGNEQPAAINVTYDCSPNWIEITSAQPTSSTSWVATLESEGLEADNWTASGFSTSSVSPTSGTLAEGERTVQTITVEDPRPFPGCGKTIPATNEVITFSSATRGEATLPVVFGERSGPGGGYDGEGDECDDEPDDDDDEEDDDGDGDGPPGGPGGPGGGGGDPHMRSFDGLRYDAQVLGEYLYAQNSDASVRMIARHDWSSTSGAFAFGVTSITGLAFEVGDHVLEIYARDSELELRLDGVGFTAPVGTLLLARDLEISQGGNSVVVDVPGMNVVVRYAPTGGLGGLVAHLDVFTYSDHVGEFTGLLGSDDGDTSNDLVGADGVAITLPTARAHGDDFLRFTESWRITDPAASPFSDPYDAFDAPAAPRPGDDALASYRQAALDQLGGLNAVCSGDLEQSPYALDVLAIEIAIGTPLDNLVDYSCEYLAVGRVTTPNPAGGSLGVADAIVATDAVGLNPCETRATSSGYYVCLMTPDLAEIGDGSSMSFPLAFDVTVTPPAGSSSVATAAGAFAAPPAFGTSVRSADIGISIDNADVMIVDLTGTLSSYGVPHTGITAFDVEYLDALDDTVGTRRRQVRPDASGAYREPFVVPVGTDDVVLAWDRGLEGDPRPTTTLTGLANGVNARTFDASYNPPVIGTTGTALINGVPPAEILITVEAEQPGGAIVERTIVAPTDPVTGGYQANRAVPIDTVSVDVRVGLPDGSLTESTGLVASPVAGFNPLVVDFIVDRAVLAVTGVATENGSPVTRDIGVSVRATGPGVDTTFDVTVSPDGVGEFSRFIELPDGADAASLTAQIGPGPSSPEQTFSSLAVGTTEVVFDIDSNYPVLNVSGVVDGSGVPFDRGVVFEVVTTTPVSQNWMLNVVPESDGSYDFFLPLPIGTSTADVTARVGFSADDWVNVPLTALVDGANDRVVDASFDAVVANVNGTLSVVGGPESGSVQLDIDRFDSGGMEVGANGQVVFVDSSGGYSTRIFMPAGTAAVQVATRQSSFSGGRIWTRFDGLVEGANSLAFSHDHNPPMLDVSGSFTIVGSPVTGVHEFDFAAAFDDPVGGSGTANFDEFAYLSVIDGSYVMLVELPEATTDVDITGKIGPEPFDYPTKTFGSIAPGVNVVDFTVDFDQPVDIDLSGTLTLDGAPFADPATVNYRVFDGAGIELGSEQQIVVPLDAAGGYSDTLSLSPSARRVEFAWTGTDGPTYESFNVAPGANTVVYSAAALSINLDISGTLLGDDGLGYTAPTQIRLGFVAPTTTTFETVDVSPDAQGAYTLSHLAPAGTRRISVRWLDADDNRATDYDVRPGANALVFDDEVGTFGTQRFVVSGTMDVGGQPWPEEVLYRLVLERLNGRNEIHGYLPITPDPVTGAFSFEYTATNKIVSARAMISESGVFESVTVDQVARDGDTNITLDVTVPGTRFEVSGTLLDDGVGANQAALIARDTTTGETGGLSFAPENDGTYAVDFLFPGEPTEVEIGVRNRVFDDDYFFFAPVAVTAGITQLTGVDMDFVPPIADISGTITRNGAPMTDPVVFELTWTDEVPYRVNEWSTTIEVTPDAAGLYSISEVGPIRADRVTIEALVPLDLASRTVEFDPLIAGSNSATLDLAYNSVGVDAAVTIGSAYIFGDAAPVVVEAFDINDELVSSMMLPVAYVNDGANDMTTLDVLADVDSTATRVQLSIDMSPYLNEDWYGYPALGPAAAYVYTHDVALTGALTTTSWTFSPTIVEVHGTAETVDGDPRKNEDFGVELAAYDGGAGGTNLGTLRDLGFTSSSSSSFNVYAFVPPETDTLVLTTDFAGAAPVEISGIAPGLNEPTVSVTTDAMNFVNVTGRLALNGRTPLSADGRDVDLLGARTIDSGDGPQLEDRAFVLRIDGDFNYVDADGNGSIVVLVPPELETLTLSAGFDAGGGVPLTETIDVSAQTGLYQFPIDLNDVAL